MMTITYHSFGMSSSPVSRSPSAPESPRLGVPGLIARTERWLVLDKPAGWLTIPPSKGESETPVLSSWARARFGDLWIVHRIDRETSGVVLFALSAEAHREANQWFEKHAVKKSYDCIAAGIASAPMLRIKKPIKGQASLTQVEVKESFREGFLARVNPASGRRHQIRIHLADEGHPLWGDEQYGGPRELALGNSVLAVSRVALHAAKLELPSKEVFEAPWPADFASWVSALRERGTHV